MYFKNLSLKKYELKNRDNIKGTLNGKKKTQREAKVVVRATVQFLALMPKVGWVCCSFSPLFQEIFLQVHQFSPLLKNHLSKFKCQVFIRHRGILPLLRRILRKTFSSLWLLFFLFKCGASFEIFSCNVTPPATKILNENPEMWFGKHNHFHLWVLQSSCFMHEQITTI